MARVYFATNRQQDALAPGGYGTNSVARPQDCDYGFVDVFGTVLAQAGSGILGPTTDQTAGAFSPAAADEIVAAGRNLLVFIHGFANSFPDAVKRAAFNRDWFAATGQPGADCSVLAFSWPSLGEVVNLHDGSILATAQYRGERSVSMRSGDAVGRFLRQALDIGARLKAADSSVRLFLLAHSMGNNALNAAVARVFDGTALPVQFDEAILAASDIHRRSMEWPGQTELYRLRGMARRISIYWSRRDAILGVSNLINGWVPLGLTGPLSARDTDLYPPGRFRIVECTDVRDLLDTDGSRALDRTHQYYRRSRRVRDDIGLLMGDGAVRQGISRLET